VQIVEFFDYNCHHCRDKAPVLDALAAKYPDGVVIYFKNFPLQGNKDSAMAAAAALAAQRQGKFLEMHHKLFDGAGAHDKSSLERYARELGLDPSRFAADLSDPGTAARVEADRQEGIKAGIQGTPTVYVGGRLMSDPLVTELLVSWVDEELAVNR
jgi:protein-disulfide isomerase